VRHGPSGFRLLLGLAAALILALHGGCVTSRESAYTTHLTATITAGRPVVNDLAIAFGLVDHELPTIAAASTEAPPP